MYYVETFGIHPADECSRDFFMQMNNKSSLEEHARDELAIVFRGNLVQCVGKLCRCLSHASYFHLMTRISLDKSYPALRFNPLFQVAA